MPEVKKCAAKSTLKVLVLQGSDLRSPNSDPVKGIEDLNTNELLQDATASSGGPAILGHQRMLWSYCFSLSSH